MRKKLKELIFRKVFYDNDEQYAKALLEKKEEEARQGMISRRDWFHLLGFHYFETIQRSNDYRAGKCKLCGMIKVHKQDELGPIIIGFIATIALILGSLVIFVLPLPPPLDWLAYFGVTSVELYFYLRKCITYYLWED